MRAAGGDEKVLDPCCPLGCHEPHLAIENLQCDHSELRCALSVTHTPDVKDIVVKRKECEDH